MRYVLGFICVLALGLMGCSETAGTGGSGGDGGTGGTDLCEGVECSDGDDCTDDICNPADGLCSYPNQPEDFPCECEGFVCKVCDGSGNCACNDDEQCERDCVVGRSCNLATGACEGGEDAPKDTPCDGGVCDAAGECVECNEAEHCQDDFNDCTTTVCEDNTCRDIPVTNGTQCAGGECEAGACDLTGLVLPCTDQGIRNAVAVGGGPYTFDCDAPTTVVLEHGIIMEKDVALNGEGQLTVELGGDEEDVHRFEIEEGASVELRAMKVRRALVNAIDNRGTLRLEDCLVAQARERGVDNVGVLELIRSTVKDNQEEGVLSEGPTLIVNSTVSGNGRGIQFEPLRLEGPVVIVSTTVAQNSEAAIVTELATQIALSNSLVEGACVIEGELVSSGYNIESPGDTCAFNTNRGDQINVSADDLKLGPLQDNGGPTQTHALLPGSVAIDVIPEVDCVDADGEPLTTDQRGEPRPVGDGCDVGAFELQP